MKTVLKVIAVTLLVLIGLGYATGVSPAWIIHGPGVATGIGSKLLCSAEHVMGSDRDQAFDDVVQYSPLLAELTVSYDDRAQTVTASLYGLTEKTASFLPGLGCAIDFDGHEQREAIAVQTNPNSDAEWPAGASVDAPDANVQALVTDMLEADNAQGLNTRALLVVHQGQIVAEAYGQGATAATPLLGWSMGKSFNAILLGNLEMRGLLDLNGTPGFAQWAGDERGQIRIADLLTMTDGLDFSEEYNPGDDATSMLFTAPSAARYVIARPAAHPPGTHFNYSSGSANVLSRVYLDALGSPQAAYDDYRKHVFEPMGFQNATLEMDASGQFVGSSYLYASARDWARIGQMMLNGGTLNGHRIVSEDWVTRAAQPNTSDNNRAYGYQFWLNDGNDTLSHPELPADAYFAKGNREQAMMMLPSQDTVIVRLGWTDGKYPMGERFRRILNAL